MLSRRTNLLPVVLAAAMGIAACDVNPPAAAGRTHRPAGASAGGPIRPEGKCWFVTAPEMAQAVDVPAVKPVEPRVAARICSTRPT
jgi:hypothetical protein